MEWYKWVSPQVCFEASTWHRHIAEPIRAPPISPLTYSPTAADSSLSFWTHTLLSPSFFWNRWSLLSWPAQPPPPTPHLLLSSSHLAPNTGGIHGGTEIQSIYSNSRPSVACWKCITFLSMCPDTKNWSFYVGHKAWFLPGLDHLHCAGSSQCRFLHLSKKKREETIQTEKLHADWESMPVIKLWIIILKWLIKKIN